MGHNWNEKDVIERLARQLGDDYVGDDAAVLDANSDPIALCADALVQNVHFDLRWWTLAQVGAKALVVNLSDLAATGAIPYVFTCTISCPKSLDIQEVLDGLTDTATRYGITLVGGDITASDTLVISVTALGVCPRGRLRRSGARPGDTLMCTGQLGASAHGLSLLQNGHAPDLTDPTIRAHLVPTPRLEEGAAALAAGATAAMDVSDGLALDLWRLADASGVGFTLDALPRFADATDREVLSGGEDFELLFTTHDPGGLNDAFMAQGLSSPIEIGTVVANPAIRTLAGEPLRPLGYLH